MDDLKTFSKKYRKKTKKRNSKFKRYGMNTVSLMIWWPKLLNLKEALFGLVRTKMGMCRVI